MCSEFRHILGSEQGPHRWQRPVNRANGLQDNVPAPHIGALFEQPLERLFAESLTGLRQGTVREQGIIGQPFCTDVEAPSDLGDGSLRKKAIPDEPPRPYQKVSGVGG